jgi:hypothetical protein
LRKVAEKVVYKMQTATQCSRLLERLQSGPISTLEARQELDICHPGGRIRNLREAGHNIATFTKVESTGKGEHKVALYALLPTIT